jgi:hypothetical protein
MEPKNINPVVGQEQQITVDPKTLKETTEGKVIVETIKVPKTPKEVTETSDFEDSLADLIDEVSALNAGSDKKAFSYEIASAIEKLKEAQVLLNSHSKIRQREVTQAEEKKINNPPLAAGTDKP